MRKINEDSFQAIKLLQKQGMNATAVSKALSISYGSVYRVFHCRDLQTYRSETNKRTKEINEKKKESRKELTPKEKQEHMIMQIKDGIPEDPDTQFDRNLRGVLEKLTNNSATFQEAMKEIREEKKRLEEAAREHRESRVRINNLVAIIRDALNLLLKEL